MTNLECYELAEADYRHTAELLPDYADFWTGLAQHCADMAAKIHATGDDNALPF